MHTCRHTAQHKGGGQKKAIQACVLAEQTEPDIAVFVHCNVWMERWRDRHPAKEEIERKREAESDRERGRRWEVRQPCMQRGV